MVESIAHIATPPPFSQHGCRRRTFRVLVAAVVHRVPGYLPRFECRLCKRTFTDYPAFALPHKRYTTPSILERAQRFFQGCGVSYRKAMWVYRQRIAYASPNGQEDLRQLSHTTLWRWLGWLGTMPVLLATVSKLIRDKAPECDLFRRPYGLDPRRYRSEQRRQVLQNAARLLDAAREFQRLFGVRFFPDFATGAGFT